MIAIFWFIVGFILFMLIGGLLLVILQGVAITLDWICWSVKKEVPWLSKAIGRTIWGLAFMFGSLVCAALILHWISVLLS